MSERYWPKDALGNDLRKGQLVSLRIPETVIICRVLDVVEAGFSGEDKDRLELQGTLSLLIQLPYRPQQLAVPQCLAVKEPEEQRIHRV